MAKKKKTAQAQTKISPERYIREKARTLPVEKCYANPDWAKFGMAYVIVTRKRPNGAHVIASFLVDTYCLGVKDAYYAMDLTDNDLEDILKQYRDHTGLEEITYDEAHNIVWGAISFAEDAGISPCKDFTTAQYVLEEDTEDVPLIDYEFGKDGKYFLVVGEDGKEKVYINTLIERLGDNFEFVAEYDDNYDSDNDYCVPEDEAYSYHYPEYPSELNVKHQFIADELADKNNYERLPQAVIDRILALPAEEVAADLNNIVLYTIGRTYRKINDGSIEDDFNGSIMHSLLLLNAIKSPAGIDTVLEIMRQTGDFADFHLGDLAPEVIPPALYACSAGNIDKIIDYLYTPGYDTYMRCNALEALVMIAIHEPERRDEIIGVFRDLLASLPERLPRKEACDPTFAGFVMSYVIDLEAKELIPEIKAVFATGLVDNKVTGDCDTVVYDIELGHSYAADRYNIPDIESQYKRIANFGE